MNKLRQLFKNVIGSDFFPLPNAQRFIFIYHDVSTPSESHHSPLYSTTPENFKNQIDFINSRFECVQLDELLLSEKLSLKRKYAAITFDDGFYSLLSQAHPLLASKSIPFSVFLNKTAIEKNQLWLSNLVLHQHNRVYLEGIMRSNRIEESEWNNFYQSPVNWILSNFEKIDIDSLFVANPSNEKKYLDENDVKNLCQRGVLMGSHTVSHPVLSKLTSEKLSKEISENKQYVESLTRKPADFFAIPFGKKTDYNETVIKTCREAGHTKLLTSNPVPVSEKENILVPRIGLTNESVHTIKFYLNRPYLKKIDI